MSEENIQLSVVLALFGQYENLIDEFDKKVNELELLGSNIEIIIVSDGSEWTYSPLYQMLPLIIKSVKTVVLEDETHLPAILCNEGLKIATGEYILFTYLQGYNINTVVQLFLNAMPKDTNVLCIRNSSANTLGVFPSSQNRYGFLQIDKFYMLDEIIIKTDIIKRMQGFNTIALLQKDFEREAMLRLSKDMDFEEIGIIERKKGDLKKYPFRLNFCNNQDLIDRYIIRNLRPAFIDISSDIINQNFANDLNVEDENLFFNFSGKKSDANLENGKKHKIMVLGGLWEYHHNQICFFNYFENLVGQGFCTYNTKFEYNVTENDIADYDLVIFSRCRSDNAIRLIEFCNKRNIPSIYMIDDNWITIANDLPKYGSIFVKGNSNYDNFIKAIENCKTTWLFNDILAKDIEPYARNITKFSISIEPKLFKPSSNKNDKYKIKIGFSGSLRSEDMAFKALSKLANEKKYLSIVLIGIVSESQRKLFEGCEIEEVGFSSYGLYAKNISKIRPDLLIAPLSKTRTERSKCYNKYVESAIVHAACLFSKTEPYTYVINDGINGFFVEEDTENGWYKKLKSIVEDIDTLRNVQENAYNDVIQKYTVESLLPEFVNKIENIIEKEYIL